MGCRGAAMKCLACGAEMRLMDVQTDTTTVCGIERHTFRCSTCPQTAQRLMFNRPRMPIIHLPVVTRPKAPAIDLQMGRPAAGSGWVNAVEKLNSKQADLKQRTAMTVRTPDWGSAVEKVSIALKQQAVAARAATWALSGSRLPDCLIETSCEGHSKNRRYQAFRHTPLPRQPLLDNFALPWTRRLCGIRVKCCSALSRRSRRVGIAHTC